MNLRHTSLAIVLAFMVFSVGAHAEASIGDVAQLVSAGARLQTPAGNIEDGQSSEGAAISATATEPGTGYTTTASSSLALTQGGTANAITISGESNLTASYTKGSDPRQRVATTGASARVTLTLIVTGPDAKVHYEATVHPTVTSLGTQQFDFHNVKHEAALNGTPIFVANCGSSGTCREEQTGTSDFSLNAGTYTFEVADTGNLQGVALDASLGLQSSWSLSFTGPISCELNYVSGADMGAAST